MKNIVFAVNDNYVYQLCVAITSILENNSRIHFFVMSCDLTPDSVEKIKHLVAKYHTSRVDFITPDITMFQDLKLNIPHISVETYFRYVIADMLPNIDKCLYLDADLVVNGKLRPFYDTELGDNYCAGVDDAFINDEKYKPKIGFAQTELYINAGVLLLNLGQMRRDNIAKKLFENTKKMANVIEYQDQDIINITLRGKIVPCDCIYNFAGRNVQSDRRNRRRACIIHYTGNKKPWHDDCENKLKRVWHKYEKIAQRVMSQKLKVALLIDEFFGGAGTTVGGYGFLARHCIAKHIPNQYIHIDVILGPGGHKFRPRKWRVDNVDLYRMPRKSWAARRFIRKKDYDVYLSIELTDNCALTHEKNHKKRLILWIQDPRPWYEWREIQTMTLLPEPCYYWQGVYDLVNWMYWQNRIKFVSQGYFLYDKARDLYRLNNDVDIQYLANPVEIPNVDDVLADKQNKILFLGRIEDVKRGWIFCEIAQKMPEYEFWVLGKINQAKLSTQGFWDKYKTIPNLHFAGHVEGAEKARHLAQAKILVNTSIHEALPVSFLEALSHGCTLVSNRNPDDLTSKFGIWVGDVLGNGFDKIDLYVDAIKKLMTDDELREEKARAGRQYVQEVHNFPIFIDKMRNLIYSEATRI